jgi:hypothetical protein
MDWNDTYRSDRKHYDRILRRPYHYDYENGHHDNPAFYPPSIKYYGFYIIRKLWANRNLRFFIVLSLLFLFALLVLVLILIIPLIGKLIVLISQQGVKGILESLTGFINRLWNGA